MKPISLHVNEQEYRSLKLLAQQSGRSVAELIREAMSDYLSRRNGQRGSIFEMAPHHGGSLLKTWTREELMDEMLER